MNGDLARLLEPDRVADPCEPRSEVVATSDRLMHTTPTETSDPWASSVAEVRWSEETAERGIDGVLAFFRERDRPFMWSIGPTSTPPSLGRRLVARGLAVEARALMLVATLPVVGFRTNPEIIVREALDESTMHDSIRVQHPDWTEGSVGAELRDRMEYIQCPGRTRHFVVAYMSTLPIAGARWRYRDDRAAVHLSGAETVPVYRNLGAYSTLVEYRTALSLARGLRYATIIARERTSAPILLKRGFVEVGRTVHYLCADPARLASSS